MGLEVNTDIKVKVEIIHLRMAPDNCGIPEIGFDVFSSPISGPFALLSQQRENFEWVDSDYCL